MQQRQQQQKDPDALWYEPLGVAGTIRLLTLHRSQDWDRIRTSLRTVHLGDATGKNAYEAVSYHESDPGHTYPVLCNGRTARVGASVFAFLQAARARLNTSGGDNDNLDDYGSGGLTLWIDALCVNQADSQERDRHVEFRQ